LSDCASLRDRVVGYFAERFGVDSLDLEGFLFVEHGGEVWAATCAAPSTLSLARPAGVRALRLTESGFKPTSAFLMLLGDKVSAGRAEVETREDLAALLLGKDLPCSLTPGFVAISFGGDVLGCGAVREGRVRAVIPTGRKKELLEALSPVRPA
jgi:NOL1/NOP2/fmu family ribosome biogenesis protein